MKYLIPLFSILVLLAACSSGDTSQKKVETPDKATFLVDIEKMEAQLKDEKVKKLDKILAKSYISKSDDFVQSFPKDPESPILLYKSAEIARAIGDARSAVQHFGQMHRDYPDHPKAPTALFLQAFLFENALEDRDEAKKYYNHFKDKYPDHQLNQQVQQLLDIIDKSPEEMVKEFKTQKK